MVNKLPGGRNDKTAEEAEDGIRDSEEDFPSETHLKFERLNIVGAGREVSVNQSATTERSVVREAVLLQSHAVPLAVSTVQALSVAA